MHRSLDRLCLRTARDPKNGFAQETGSARGLSVGKRPQNQRQSNDSEKERDHRRQNSPLAPAPPERPPANCGFAVSVTAGADGDRRGWNAAEAVLTTVINLESRLRIRAAVKPNRVPLGPPASQRRIQTAAIIRNRPNRIGSHVCCGKPRYSLFVASVAITIAPLTSISRRSRARRLRLKPTTGRSQIIT